MKKCAKCKAMAIVIKESKFINGKFTSGNRVNCMDSDCRHSAFEI